MAINPLSPKAKAKLVELIRENNVCVERYNPHKECPDEIAIAVFGGPLPRSMCSLCGKILQGEQLKLISQEKGICSIYYLDEACYQQAKNQYSLN